MLTLLWVVAQKGSSSEKHRKQKIPLFLGLRNPCTDANDEADGGHYQGKPAATGRIPGLVKTITFKILKFL
jgi:hypothetical protein